MEGSPAYGIDLGVGRAIEWDDVKAMILYTMLCMFCTYHIVLSVVRNPDFTHKTGLGIIVHLPLASSRYLAFGLNMSLTWRCIA